MRPTVLNPLFADLLSLPGIGPRIAKAIEVAIGGRHVADLLWHFPTGAIDRRFAPSLADVPVGALVTVTARVDAHQPPRHKRQPYKITLSDATGALTLVFFRGNADYLKRQLPEGEVRVISGRAQEYGGGMQITHPDHIGTLEEQADLQAIEPTYRLVAGVTQKPMQKALRAVLARVPELPEWHSEDLVAREKWTPWREAVLTVHAPQSEADLALETTPHRRLAYDELLANQLALLLMRRNMRRKPGRAIRGDGRLRARITSVLPYRLTASQEQALTEILVDMEGKSRMLRLLQGDVGSGKTVVALLAMLAAVEMGAQAALMAPTEILARQHHAVLNRVTEGSGLRIALLTGRGRGKGRESLLRLVARREVDIVVGTHALLQEEVSFPNLALAVVDEQHRFGVHQRMSLTAQTEGPPPDVLVMSATPIPRTLTLTAYGDMDVSRLDEKPPGRRPVSTSAVSVDRISEVVAGLQRAVNNGARAYWVCPLVTESEALDLAAAEDRFASLQDSFGDRVGLAHGKMKPAVRDESMERFASGDLSLLVATTVIEVGVDVPEATVMVIEHAERFGLAQLHQLRGRVGRGSSESSCILLYARPLTEMARARLKILRETEDGFRIAEEDLRLRGAGEILGVRQSGLPQFRVADLEAHADLLSLARDDALEILQRDPELNTSRGKGLRTLLYLFERDAAVGLIGAG